MKPPHSNGTREMTERWYRYGTVQYASVDEFDNVSSSAPVLQVNEYEVIKRTPKGVWLKHGFVGKRFVLASARKRWACPTKEDAMESFIQRKHAHIRILEAQLGNARYALKLALREIGATPMGQDSRLSREISDLESPASLSETADGAIECPSAPRCAPSTLDRRHEP